MYDAVPRITPIAVRAGEVIVAPESPADETLDGGAPGEPEVEHLHVAVVGDLDVPGLQIPVDDAGVVGGGEGIGDLPRQSQRFRDWNRAMADPRREIFAVDQLHGDERPGAFASGVVDVGDVRVIQGGERPGFTGEAHDAVGVGGEGVGQDLQRDVTIELGVAGPVDLAHPAGSDRSHDLVLSDPRSGS